MKLGLPASAPEQGLAGRLAWISGTRLGFLALLLAGTTFVYLRGDLTHYPFSVGIVFVTIASAFALSAIYMLLLRRGARLALLADAQIMLDQITWTAIVYVSGGATSGATSFYALTALVGTILTGLHGAALAAVTGIALYGSLCLGFRMRWIVPPPDQAAANYALEAVDLTYPLLVNTLGIVVVALLAGYLAERLRLTGGALAAANQRAREAERLAVLGRLAAGLAHEIRNPLGSISGSIELLREAPELSEDDRRLCDIIRREATRLNNLVTDMVDLSKPRPPRAEAVDVVSLAREIVALAAGSDRSSVGDVPVHYEGPAATLLARCDGAQMRQVLWNLVRNAVQASAAGSAVTVRVEAQADEVILTVDDCGGGIEQDEAKRIFDAFYTTRTHGTGIGLAVVKRIIDDHASMGARISVHNLEVGGASFRVRLRTDVAGLRPSYRPRTTPSA